MFSNKLLWFLGAVLIVTWGHVFYRVASVWGDSGVEVDSVNTVAIPDASLLDWKSIAVDTTLTDPFQSYFYKRPQEKKTTPTLKVKKNVEKPSAVLQGILWGQNPTAILKQSGKTEIVKKGDEVWGLKILAVEKNKVVVQKEGARFELSP